MPLAFYIKGRIDIGRLESAFNNIISRHPVLCSTFFKEGNNIFQRIQQAVEFKLTSYKVDDFFNEISSIETYFQEFIRPFDLSSECLIRSEVIQFREDEYLLLIDIHHIVADGRSIQILQQDLVRFYHGQEIATLHEEYRQFIADRSKNTIADIYLRQREYWESMYAKSIVPLELPTDKSRRVNSENPAKNLNHELEITLSENLIDFSRKSGVSVFMTLLSGLYILLHKITSQNDIIIGLPVDARGKKTYDQLMGMFVNTLPLRYEINSSQTVGYLLRKIRELVLNSLDNQDYPLEKIVENVKITRELNRNALFDVLLNFNNILPATIRSGDILFKQLNLPNRHAKLDLSISISSINGKKGINCTYNSMLFDTETVKRYLCYYEKILTDICRNPQKPIDQISIISEEEKNYQLNILGTKQEYYDFKKDIVKLFEKQVGCNPGYPAVKFADSELDYNNLNNKSNELAWLLHQKGIRTGKIVPVMIDHSLELAISIMAVMKTGAAFSPIDLNWPAERINYILSQTEDSVLLVRNGCDTQWVSPGYTRIVVDSDQLKGTNEKFPTPDLIEELIYVIYTSGTTGKPKGVSNTHKGILNRLLWMNDYFGENSSGSVLQTTRYVFDSFVWQLLWPLINGGKCILTKSEELLDPEKVFDMVYTEKIKIIDFVPSLFKPFVDHVLANPESKRKLESLNEIITGGGEEARRTDMKRFMEKFPAIRLTNLYGPTEASIGCVYYNFLGSEDERVPIGKPVSNTQIIILDNQSKLVPLGSTGEICISGTCLSRGYLANEELTARSFVDHPYIPNAKMYKTGDLGRWKTDGNIEFLGRKDDQIKIRGHRVELSEINSVLEKLESIKESVVVTRGTGSGVMILAFVVTAGLTSTNKIRNHLRESLPDYMIPSHIIKVNNISTTAGGKRDKRALLQYYENNVKNMVSSRPPSTPVEIELAKAWRNILNIEKIDLDSKFFEIGGHSLMLIELNKTIRINMGMEIPLSYYYSYSLEDIARILGEYIRKTAGN